MKIPKGEQTWVFYCDKEDNPVFVLTSKENSRDWYFLYRITDGKLEKLGKARTPPELEEKYGVSDVILSSKPEEKKKTCRKKKTVVQSAEKK